MPKFCANLSWLFTELPLLDRLQAAADAGFTGVEILFPYEAHATQIAERLRATGLQMALINCPPRSAEGTAPGYAAIPGAEAQFRGDFAQTLDYAAQVGAQHIHIMAGASDGPAARETFIRNLQWAADTAPGQSLTIEPINRHDMPGYFLCDFDQAASVLDEVSRPNVNLQFDAYHAQRIHGDALAVWTQHGNRAVHVQVAQTPKRSEPNDGSAEPGGIDYPAFFQLLEAQGFDGWVSGEYRPKATTAEGLGWIRYPFYILDPARA